MQNIPIRITSMGPADFGKSTLFGYIVLHHLNDPNYWKQIEAWEQERPDWYRKDRAYTYLFDKIQDERKGHLSQEGKRKFEGASIVPTYVECTIGAKTYLFIDVPGHEKFISNATTGIFQAQAAVLVLAANDLEPLLDMVQEINRYYDNQGTLVQHIRNSRFWNICFYPILVRTYGFQQLIVVISKMDLVQYDQLVYELSVEEVRPFLARFSDLPPQAIHVIPTSIQVEARSDLNVIHPVPAEHPMSWYQGPTVVEQIAQIPALQPSKGPLLIPVEEMYLKRVPGSPCIVTGRIIRGTLSKDQEIQISPLCDPAREFHDTEKLRGRVKHVRQRDQKAQLPWIGKIPLESPAQDQPFEAGHIIGLTFHPYEKTKYSPEKYPLYFRKGCIITNAGDAVISGNVLRAEVFVPIYSRKITEGQQWLVYLYGQKKGDALVLSVCPREEQLREDEKEIGDVIEVELLLGFPVDYPGVNGSIDADVQDVVLRQNTSFCGGRTLRLYFIERCEMVLTYPRETFPEKEEILAPFQRFYHLSKLRKLPDIFTIEQDRWHIVAPHPTSEEMSLLYHTVKKMKPSPGAYSIELFPKYQTYE